MMVSLSPRYCQFNLDGSKPMTSAGRFTLLLVFVFAVARVVRQDASDLHIDGLVILAAVGVGWLVKRSDRHRNNLRSDEDGGQGMVPNTFDRLQ
ncbi:hypothetical protein SAMN06265222_1315 [Neorhodopirellula lusitana]|uniref:Uncharacterized protein n=1 Tax=Neorhodopirellula lusitana TaxID=445327 RepID=A0ABY1QSP8_9BACT|nr:hypothetical protein SAMN06265222_1315 [Neorhodopirellula lusitana]